MHSHIKEITEDIKELKYNTAIAELMVVLNKLEKGKPGSINGTRESTTRKDFETFLLLLAPFAPFITEELWETLAQTNAEDYADQRRKTQRKSASSQRKSAFRSIHKHSWPKYDTRYLTQDTFTLIVQVNGKVRARISAGQGISEKDAGALALAHPQVQKFTEGKKIERTIFVKDRLINFVV